VDGVAWHGYMGTPGRHDQGAQRLSRKGAYWTEGGSFIDAPDYTADWTKWSGTYAGILKNWRAPSSPESRSRRKRQAHIGPFACGGVVTLDSKTQKITRSGQYWAFAHYSKAVRRGARVISSKATLPGIEHVAFANPDGDYVLVSPTRETNGDRLPL